MSTPVVAKPARLQPRPSWLIHLVAIVATGTAFAVAPAVAGTHPATALAQFFSSSAQISATLLVAVALFQGALGDLVAHRVRAWISPPAFVYVGTATAAGVAGSIATLGDDAYHWLFALTVGPGAAGLLTVLAMGWENLEAQRQRSIIAAATNAGQSSPCAGAGKSPEKPKSPK
jgi:hypothetical protein